MLIGVLDIGSNTGHLMIAEAESGTRPVHVHKYRKMLRLAEHVDAEGALTAKGLDRLVSYVARARAEADALGCDVLPVATATIRDAPNREEIVTAVREASGFDLTVLSGEREAQLTFLAARRWLGWFHESPDRLGVFDVGGGSLEIAVGTGEVPEEWTSSPLGAGRLTREWVRVGRSPDDLRAHVRSVIEPHVATLLRGGLDLAVGTSKTMRMLGRICGEPLTSGDLSGLVEQIAGMGAAEISELPGVSTKRADQVLAGSIVAAAVMELFCLDTIQICPWALREGVLLRHLDDL